MIAKHSMKLGAPVRQHAHLARTFATNAEIALQKMKSEQSCRLRFNWIRRVFAV